MKSLKVWRESKEIMKVMDIDSMLNKAYRYVHIFDPDSTLDHSTLIQQFEKLYIPFTHLTQLSE